MDRLKTYEEMVREILIMDERTRDDDRILALQVWTTFYGVNKWAPVKDVMTNKRLPSQESLGRCRRRLQEKDESLRGSKSKEKIRMAAQIDFIEYARR